MQLVIKLHLHRNFPAGAILQIAPKDLQKSVYYAKMKSSCIKYYDSAGLNTQKMQGAQSPIMRTWKGQQH